MPSRRMLATSSSPPSRSQRGKMTVLPSSDVSGAGTMAAGAGAGAVRSAAWLRKARTAASMRVS